MISTQPVVVLLAILMALLYGIMFLFIFSYPMMWIDVYHESIGISSLNYISAGLGYSIGAQGVCNSPSDNWQYSTDAVAGHINDHLYMRLTERNAGTGKPEFRIPILVPGAFFVTVGLFIYGWTGKFDIHWIVPNIGSFIFCLACMLCTSGIKTYTIDAYKQYAASTMSALNVLRNMTAIVFSLFAPYMFDRLGFGLGCTVLAGSWALISSALLMILWT